MKGRDEIKDLFSDKLGNFEAQVRPDIWSNIASQIGGTTTTVASSGLSLLSKIGISVGIGAAVITTVLLVKPSDTPSTEKNNPIKTVSSTDNKKETTPITTVEEEIIKESIVVQNGPANKTTDAQKEIHANKEIDQNQNFRSEISLIDVKKETSEIESGENNNNSDERQQSASSKKEGEESAAPDVKEVDNIENQVSKQPETPKTTYSLAKLPNVFTPNGDGENDALFITSEGLQDFTIVVLDEKQKVVFESNSPDFKWDGTDKGGNKVTPGNYGYYIIAQDSNGNKVNKFTTLQIIF